MEGAILMGFALGTRVMDAATMNLDVRQHLSDGHPHVANRGEAPGRLPTATGMVKLGLALVLFGAAITGFLALFAYAHSI